MNIVKQSINIQFPFEESNLGHFFNMTINSNQAAISNFKFFLTLKENDLLYKKSSGLNIYKYLFDPITNELINDITLEIKDKTKLFFPFIKIKKINVLKNLKNYLIGINIELSIHGELFNETINLI